jgi:hypothetical protein
MVTDFFILCPTPEYTHCVYLHLNIMTLIQSHYKYIKRCNLLQVYRQKKSYI